MALDLYTESFEASINHNEEYVLQVASESCKYPLISDLFSNYYKHPKLNHELCVKIAQEFLSISETMNDDITAVKMCNRISLFFINAYIQKESVNSHSD